MFKFDIQIRFQSPLILTISDVFISFLTLYLFFYIFDLFLIIFGFVPYSDIKNIIVHRISE